MVLWLGLCWVVSRPETSQSSAFHFGGVEVESKPKSNQMYEKSVTSAKKA